MTACPATRPPAKRDAEVEAQWASLLSDLGLEGAEELSRSALDPGRRTYLARGRVHKVVLRELEQTQHLRACHPREEHAVLVRLQGLDGVPSNPSYQSSATGECVAYDYMPGTTLDRVSLAAGDELLALARLAWLLLRLSRRGVAHNDLVPQNLLLAPDGRVGFLDFDQSILLPVREALSLNFLGAPPTSTMPSVIAYSLFARRALRKHLPARLRAGLRRLRDSLYRAFPSTTLPRLERGSPDGLRLLQEAWLQAQRSDASSPGAPLAYYELVVDGHRFPGERPWALRWSMLRRSTPLAGKRVLELGCNLGLLSCSALGESGAAAALAVDCDARILGAAQLVARALGAAPLFQRVNFDADPAWEDELERFRPDVVFALNVLNWVADKERFMRFLGRFQEVVYEGHDAFEIERRRFEAVGFRSIEQLGKSERERCLLLCRK